MPKKCSTCGEFKASNDYHKKGKGRRADCKLCNNKRRKSNYEKDIEINRATARDYYLKNKEKRAKYKKEYNELNKGRIKKEKKAYYEANKAEISKKSAIWRAENKEHIQEKSKEYWELNRERELPKLRAAYQKNKKDRHRKQKELRKTNKIVHLKHNTSCAIRDPFRRKGFKKTSKTEAILGCSLEEFQTHLKGTFEFNYGIPFNHIETSMLHIDHITPLASAKTEEEVLKLNHYSNLQYLFAEDNLEKRDKLNWELV